MTSSSVTMYVFECGRTEDDPNNEYIMSLFKGNASGSRIHAAKYRRIGVS